MPAFCAVRAAERALLVAEQFALHQVIRQRAAVDIHPGPFAAQREIVHRARHDFFTRSALSADQDGGVGARDLLHQAEHGFHALASDDGAAHDVALILGLRRLQMVLRVPRGPAPASSWLWRGAARCRLKRLGSAACQCVNLRGHRHTSNIRSIGSIFNSIMSYESTSCTKIMTRLWPGIVSFGMDSAGLTGSSNRC